MQHRQHATWEPAVVINQTDAPTSYWVMQENGAQQPKKNRHTRSFLKVRSTHTDGEVKAEMKEWMPEKEMLNFSSQLSLIGLETSWLRILRIDLHPVVLHHLYPHWIFQTPGIFQNEGRRWPACRTIVHKWYYTENCTKCTRYTSPK